MKSLNKAKSTLMAYAPAAVAKQWDASGEVLWILDWGMGPKETLEFLKGKGVRDIADNYMSRIAQHPFAMEAVLFEYQRPTLFKAAIDHGPANMTLETLQLVREKYPKAAELAGTMIAQKYGVPGLVEAGMFDKDLDPESKPFVYLRAVEREFKHRDPEDAVELLKEYGFSVPDTVEAIWPDVSDPDTQEKLIRLVVAEAGTRDKVSAWDLRRNRSLTRSAEDVARVYRCFMEAVEELPGAAYGNEDLRWFLSHSRLSQVRIPDMVIPSWVDECLATYNTTGGQDDMFSKDLVNGFLGAWPSANPLDAAAYKRYRDWIDQLVRAGYVVDIQFSADAVLEVTADQKSSYGIHAPGARSIVQFDDVGRAVQVLAEHYAGKYTGDQVTEDVYVEMFERIAQCFDAQSASLNTALGGGHDPQGIRESLTHSYNTLEEFHGVPHFHNTWLRKTAVSREQLTEPVQVVFDKMFEHALTTGDASYVTQEMSNMVTKALWRKYVTRRVLDGDYPVEASGHVKILLMMMFDGQDLRQFEDVLSVNGFGDVVVFLTTKYGAHRAAYEVPFLLQNPAFTEEFVNRVAKWQGGILDEGVAALIPGDVLVEAGFINTEMVPVSALVGNWDRWAARAVANVISDRFGSDEQAWFVAAELMPDWEGGLPSLLDTVEASIG